MEGTRTLYVQERDEAGNWSASGSFDIVVDLTPADPPVVDGGTPTNDTTPEWTWSSGGGDGNSLFRYKLDDADLTSGATETAETTFTPDSALTEETHTLYVQERDEAGNWSDSGRFVIVVEVTRTEERLVLKDCR